MSSAAEIGSRIALARQKAGLTQNALARLIGARLWTVEELERGAGDFARHRKAIAAATDRPPGWFEVPSISADVPGSAESRARLLQGELKTAIREASGRTVVLSSLAMLVLIRFFTEVVHVLPRALNFVDIPIFFVLGIAALSRRAERVDRHRGRVAFGLPVLLFIGLCTISVTLNTSRVELAPVLVFVYGFLAPIGVYAAVYRLWPAGHARSLSRLLVALVVVELLVVIGIDLPRFASSGNPDVISGTFGTNAYQLVFFLLLATGLLAGIFTLEPRRPAARFAPLLFVLILGTIFLAQYRALLVTTAVTVVVIAALLGLRARGLVTAAIISLSFGFTLSYVASHFPLLKFAPTIATLQESPGFYISKRLDSAGNVVSLYSSDPRFIVTGSGPGTFSSRSWQTFALAGSTSASNVQGRYAKALTGGRIYRTDVSDEYIVKGPGQAAFIGGSTAVTTPFSSYLSLLSEVGVLGFLLIVGMYLVATGRALRITLRVVRDPSPGDSLPALALASVVAFTVLLQMGLLENWFEVTRVTFLTWALLAVTSKEFDARYRSTV